MEKICSLVLAGKILAASVASAAVFSVTSVNDNGAGSLRQAIMDANASPGANTINFNIPGGSVQTIAPTNALPDITNTVAINGYSQTGSSANTLTNGDNAIILIRLDGSKISGGSPIGVNFSGVATSGSSVRGLCIIRFSNGVKANEASSITIAGNWIGMDLDGVARGTTFEGIYISSFFNPANNIIIGGASPAERNVISGNRYGIYFNGSTTGNSFVQGNFIGTDPTGTLPRGNLFGGVYIFGGTNITVGGANAGARNIINGATAAGGTGVTVQGGPGNLIQGNLIGTDVTGQYDLGNISDGVYVTGSQNTRILGNEIVNNRANGINLASSSGAVVENNYIGTEASATRPLGNALAGITITGSTNRVGGLNAAQPNTIQFNGGAGVAVTASSAMQNEISANRIFDNGGLGIDLGVTGITTNDVLDADLGANGLQNFPVLTNAAINFSSLSVQGTFNSAANAAYRLEFFATPNWDAAGIPEGQTFLGATNVTTDGNGNAVFNCVFATTPATNSLITATATDANGNSSEFSSAAGIVPNGIASPSLAISGGGVSGGGANTATVTWPSAAFFTLEQAGSLTPPVQWQAVTSGITDLGGIKSFAFSGGTNTNQFFRLKKP